MAYREEEFLNIAGIQHFSYCRRQWALIHIEQQWQENIWTVEGGIMHEKAHDALFTEKRGDVLISRGMAVFSGTLGVNGVCDVVELHESPDGIPIFGRDGKWRPMLVEYKRGKPKENDADRLQLCCQAMCLEEMLGCDIPEASLFYGETNRRNKVPLDRELRDKVQAMLLEMHALYSRGHTPKVKPGANCKACSLADLCLPKMMKQTTVAAYLGKKLREDTL